MENPKESKEYKEVLDKINDLKLKKKKREVRASYILIGIFAVIPIYLLFHGAYITSILLLLYLSYQSLRVHFGMNKQDHTLPDPKPLTHKQEKIGYLSMQGLFAFCIILCGVFFIIKGEHIGGISVIICSILVYIFVWNRFMKGKKDHDKLMDEFQKQKDDEHIAKSKLDNK